MKTSGRVKTSSFPDQTGEETGKLAGAGHFENVRLGLIMTFEEYSCVVFLSFMIYCLRLY